MRLPFRLQHPASHLLTTSTMSSPKTVRWGIMGESCLVPRPMQPLLTFFLASHRRNSADLHQGPAHIAPDPQRRRYPACCCRRCLLFVPVLCRQVHLRGRLSCSTVQSHFIFFLSRLGQRYKRGHRLHCHPALPSLSECHALLGA